MSYRVTEIMRETTFLRVARKEHRCAGGHNGQTNVPCRKPIRKGERYVESCSETPLFQSGNRYHFECAVQQGILEAEP